MVARWTIPTGFLIFILSLYQLGEEHLTNLASENSKWQFIFYFVGEGAHAEDRRYATHLAN